MNALKLPKLPDRTPVKLSISILPDLHQRLQDYANAYAEYYGNEEQLVELIPAMLAAFLEGDRFFNATRRQKARESK